MPLTKSGKKILLEFKKRYGKRGKGFFYATMKKNPKKTILWHKKTRRKS